MGMQKNASTSPILFVLGQHIKYIRNVMRLSQSQLAQNCGMEKSSISKIEAGLVNVGYLTLHRISKGLGVLVCDLCKERIVIKKPDLRS
jgi:transcriptional regulator with XRE-family HTH domain